MYIQFYCNNKKATFLNFFIFQWTHISFSFFKISVAIFLRSIFLERLSLPPRLFVFLSASLRSFPRLCVSSSDAHSGQVLWIRAGVAAAQKEGASLRLKSATYPPRQGGVVVAPWWFQHHRDDMEVLWTCGSEFFVSSYSCCCTVVHLLPPQCSF